jgi:hyperosmotically inducible periplasmic protein
MPYLANASPTLLSLLAAAALLGACDRRDDSAQTAGQRIDEAVAKVENKSQELGADAREAGRDASSAVVNAGRTVADKSRDLGISTEINGLLAKDNKLSALRINVDTTAGQVVLRGTAPDTAARDHATELAQSVGGVLGVDNQLSVQARN